MARVFLKGTHEYDLNMRAQYGNAICPYYYLMIGTEESVWSKLRAAIREHGK